MNQIETTYANFIESVCRQYNIPDAVSPLVEGFDAYCVISNQGLTEGWTGNTLKRLGKAAAIGSLAFNAAHANMFDSPVDASNATTQLMVGNPNDNPALNTLRPGRASINIGENSANWDDEKEQQYQQLKAKRERYNAAMALAMGGHPETLEKILLDDFVQALKNGEDTNKIKQMCAAVTGAFNTNTYGKLIEIESNFERESKLNHADLQDHLDQLEDKIIETIETLSATKITNTVKNIANAKYRKYKSMYDKLISEGAVGNYPEWESDFLDAMKHK